MKKHLKGKESRNMANYHQELNNGRGKQKNKKQNSNQKTLRQRDGAANKSLLES